MRTLLHLSDLHFGRVDASVLAPLRDYAAALSPDLVVVSGDLTQRARSQQFIQAREFLDGLPQPQLVVPGNHDVPLFNIFSRFLRPRRKYRRHIHADTEPTWVDGEIAVAGIDTTRSLTIKDGRINPDQVERVHAFFAAQSDRLVKIVVSHHPFDLPETEDNDNLVHRAPLAMNAFARSGVDLLLSGHLHVSHAGDVSAQYRVGNFSALLIQAGTATSTRARGETNSFNVLRVSADRIHIERIAWQPETQAFATAQSQEFARNADGWKRADR